MIILFSVGNTDSPHVASLLESLPFSWVLIHGVGQLSSQIPEEERLSQGRSMALLALTEALSHSGLRELLKRRLQVVTEDHLELVCSVNAILKLLELIYKVLTLQSYLWCMQLYSIVWFTVTGEGPHGN